MKVLVVVGAGAKVGVRAGAVECDGVVGLWVE